MTALKEAEQVLGASGISEADIRSLKESHRLNSLLNVRSPIDASFSSVWRWRTASRPAGPLVPIGKLDELWLEIDAPKNACMSSDS